MAQHKAHHKWVKTGEDIYQCTTCGLYRCHALTNYCNERGSRKRIANVEYSGLRGNVVAMNPPKQPPCERGIYA